MADPSEQQPLPPGPVSDEEFKESLRARAREYGFFDARIAQADLPEHYGRKLSAWLKNGMHGEMGYMEKTAPARSQGAEAVLPGARSVIVFAASYASGQPESEPVPPGSVAVARYALGRDYHFVLKERLSLLLPWLDAMRPGHSWRICTDSAPLNERAYAAESGMGFFGKNAMLIAHMNGSCFLLAEIVTTAEITPDSPVPGDCGRCTRCLDACPVDAIVAPGTVNARRCISYLTIEKKTPLTEQEMESTGSWIFGCDICQDVCPCNKHPVQSQIPDFQDGLVVHHHEPLSTFLDPPSNSRFEKGFPESPILRPGRRRVQQLARFKQSINPDEEEKPGSNPGES